MKKHIAFIRRLLGILTVLIILTVLVYRLTGHMTRQKVFFNLFQCACMQLILIAPYILKKEWSITIPTELHFLVFSFAFCGLILGDVFDFYHLFPWWDSMLHYLSGIIIPFFGIWLIHLLMKEKSQYIYMNKVFVDLFVVCLVMGCGAIWEIGEYTYDDLFGTNTQQFMATTESSIYGKKDQPLEGHAALHDTMKDLKLALAGSLTVVAYTNIKGVKFENKSED